MNISFIKAERLDQEWRWAINLYSYKRNLFIPYTLVQFDSDSSIDSIIVVWVNGWKDV